MVLTKDEIALAISMLDASDTVFENTLNDMDYELMCNLSRIFKEFFGKLNAEEKPDEVIVKEHKLTDREIRFKYPHDSPMKHDLRVFIMSLSMEQRQQYKHAFKGMQ